jgi:transposase
MHLYPRSRVDIFIACSRVQQVCLEVQHMRWVAAQARYRSRLTRLARHMPHANRLTRAITAEILAQHGLLAPVPRHEGMAVLPSLSEPVSPHGELSHHVNRPKIGFRDQLA